jgi:hypothetical protein
MPNPNPKFLYHSLQLPQEKACTLLSKHHYLYIFVLYILIILNIPSNQFHQTYIIIQYSYCIYLLLHSVIVHLTNFIYTFHIYSSKSYLKLLWYLSTHYLSVHTNIFFESQNMQKVLGYMKYLDCSK